MRSRVTPEDSRAKEYISEDPRELVEAPEEWGKDMWDAKRPEAQIIAGGLNHRHRSARGPQICHLSKGMRSAFTREEISETVKGIKHRKSRGLEGGNLGGEGAIPLSLRGLGRQIFTPRIHPPRRRVVQQAQIVARGQGGWRTRKCGWPSIHPGRHILSSPPPEDYIHPGGRGTLQRQRLPWSAGPCPGTWKPGHFLVM